MEQANQRVDRAGWPLRAWCASANVSPATFYAMPKETKPASVKIGKRRIIIEAPDAWLRRMAEEGGC
jgi:hypothetical protein